MPKFSRLSKVALFSLAALALAAPARGAKDKMKLLQEANELFKQGEAEYEKEDYEAAIEKFEKCLAKDPENADAQFNIGVCYTDLGDPDKALEAYRKTLAIEPHYHHAYFNIGRIYHLRKDFVQAAMYYEKALAEDPYAPDLLYNYAHALMEGGRVEEAAEAWDRYLTIAEQLPEEAKWVERAKEYLATLESVSGGAPEGENE
jgi:tetratricopeptide (TPR) repeat protein